MDSQPLIPLTIRQTIAVIPLHSDSGRCYAIVDPGDAAKVLGYGWFRHRRTGYATTVNGSGHLVTLHQAILGAAPRGMVIDHASGDKLDNRRANLRVVTVAENGLNRHRSNRNNRSSRHVGVTFIKREGKWRAQARWKGKDYHGGYFDTEEEAATAARLLRERLPRKGSA